MHGGVTGKASDGLPMSILTYVSAVGESQIQSVLRRYLDVAGFNRLLQEIISPNKLASTWLDHVIEENCANRISAGAWVTVVKNGKEGCVKLIVESWIACLPN